VNITYVSFVINQSGFIPSAECMGPFGPYGNRKAEQEHDIGLLNINLCANSQYI